MRMNLNQIGQNPDSDKPAVSGGNWMDKLKEIVGTVKELTEITREIRQLETGGKPTGAMTNAGGDWGKFLTMLIQSGYGDKPIGELITMVAPYTIKQLIALAKQGGKNDTGNSE